MNGRATRERSPPMRADVQAGQSACAPPSPDAFALAFGRIHDGVPSANNRRYAVPPVFWRLIAPPCQRMRNE